MITVLIIPSPQLFNPPQEQQDNITTQACQDEVFYYELMEVTDFRNDVILAEACRSDVEVYCKDVEPGERNRDGAVFVRVGRSGEGL